MAAIVLSSLSLILTGRTIVSLRDKARQTVSNVGRALLLTFVIIYLLIDLIFLSILRPLRRRLLVLPWLRNFRTKLGSLNRYSALFLLLVPWLILEPLKPLSIVLFTHKHHLSATLLMIGGEVVKLTLFEQIFRANQAKAVDLWLVRLGIRQMARKRQLHSFSDRVATGTQFAPPHCSTITG